jgi:hypothetical protein
VVCPRVLSTQLSVGAIVTPSVMANRTSGSDTILAVVDVETTGFSPLGVEAAIREPSATRDFPVLARGRKVSLGRGGHGSSLPSQVDERSSYTEVN